MGGGGRGFCAGQGLQLHLMVGPLKAKKYIFHQKKVFFFYNFTDLSERVGRGDFLVDISFIRHTWELYQQARDDQFRKRSKIQLMDDTYNNSTVLLESSFMEVREAAKISYFLDVRAIKALPPPPSSIMAVNFFYSQINRKRILTIFSPPIFGLKDPYFLPNIVTNQ